MVKSSDAKGSPTKWADWEVLSFENLHSVYTGTHTESLVFDFEGRATPVSHRHSLHHHIHCHWRGPSLEKPWAEVKSCLQNALGSAPSNCWQLECWGTHSAWGAANSPVKTALVGHYCMICIVLLWEGADKMDRADSPDFDSMTWVLSKSCMCALPNVGIRKLQCARCIQVRHRLWLFPVTNGSWFGRGWCYAWNRYIYI